MDYAALGERTGNLLLGIGIPIGAYYFGKYLFSN